MTRVDNRRILLIDDNSSIHEDIRKTLVSDDTGTEKLDDMRAAFLGTGTQSGSSSDKEAGFEIDSALQGQEGLEKLCAALEEDRPYAMAFVDMRMPPGWDGVTTIQKLWEKDPKLQVVICTAFSDYSWEETVQKLGQSDRLLILKKPFDEVEIRQLACALVEKWNAAAREMQLIEDVRRSEQEARSYASSLETMNRALVTSKAASDMAAETRTEFLLQLSEEVSSKIGEVLGGVELLRQPCESSGVDTQALDLVLDASHRLLYTIAEILDVTELELGRTRVEEEPCSPRKIAEGVIAEFREPAQARGIELILEGAAAVPETVNSEPKRIRQILCSLLENAIDSIDSGSGSVTVTLSTTQTASWKRPQLCYEVADTGTGIPKERMGTLFEPFAREADGQEQTGCGFGLALAKRLATLVGGDLAARSEPGKGSTFILTLNVGPVVSQQEAA